MLGLRSQRLQANLSGRSKNETVKPDAEKKINDSYIHEADDEQKPKARKRGRDFEM